MHFRHVVGAVLFVCLWLVTGVLTSVPSDPPNSPNCARWTDAEGSANPEGAWRAARAQTDATITESVRKSPGVHANLSATPCRHVADVIGELNVPDACRSHAPPNLRSTPLLI